MKAKNEDAEVQSQNNKKQRRYPAKRRKGRNPSGKQEEYKRRRRAEVAKIRGQGGRQEEIRESGKETRNRREDRTSGIPAGKENAGWNREEQSGRGQGMKARNEDANVLKGGRQENELRNPGGAEEQRKESGGAGRKRTRNESQG